MKRFCCLFLCAILLLSLSACTGTTPSTEPAGTTEPTPSETVAPEAFTPSLRFSREDFPRLNGSTSTVPLGQAIASVLLGESREDVADLIQFSKTTQSFRELMNGQADLLISAEPAESIWQEKEEKGFEWEMAPFAIDGLVFIVNADNPVDSLTVEQIQKIYTGEITNWSEVGGDDLQIAPFQRNTEAGSQTAMLKLVMKDLPMMEAPTQLVMGGMGELIQAVAAYDGTPAAIGYTVYYYANDMKMADGLKILAVEGVTPCADTIRKRDYPFLNNYYVLTAAGLPEDDPARLLYNWILSQEGQRLVAHEGYVSVLDVGDDSAWPGLTPYEQALFTYSEYYRKGEPLRTGDDYGTLLPYVGLSLSALYYTEPLPLYGLVTGKGEIVTDALYTNIFVNNGILVLCRGSDEGYQESIGQDSGFYDLTVAATDGHWLRQFDDSVFIDCWAADGGLLVIGNKTGDLLFLNVNGDIVATFPVALLREYFGSVPDWSSMARPWLEYYEGLIYLREYLFIEETNEFIEHNLYLELATGQVLTGLPEGYPEQPEYPPSIDPPSFPGYTYCRRDSDVITGEVYYHCYLEDGSTDLLDEKGNVVWEGYSDMDLYDLMDGKIAFWPNRWEADDGKTNCFSWYDLKTGECLFRYPIGDNSD